MNKLLAYINSLPVAEQAAYARRCGTSVGYLRKAISSGSRMGVNLCISLTREGDGSFDCQDLRPDIDWASLRKTARSAQRKQAA